MKTDQVQAIASFHSDGRTVAQGERLDATDPLVAARPELFGPAGYSDEVVSIDSFISRGRTIQGGQRLSADDPLVRAAPHLFYPAAASDLAAAAAIAAYRERAIVRAATVTTARMVRGLGRRGRSA